MVWQVYASLGLVGASTCTTSFCVFTLEYLAANVDALQSGVKEFLLVFPWGWLVSFGKETFQTPEGSFNPVPSFNLVATYFNFWIIALLWHRDARRLGLTKWFAVCAVIGTFFCFSTFMLIFLVKRALVVAALEDPVDKQPMNLGRSGYAIIFGGGTTMVALGALLYAGESGGNDILYGAGLGYAAVLCSIAYALFFACDNSDKQLSPGPFKGFLVVCAFVAAAGYANIGRACMSEGFDWRAGFATWCTLVFQSDMVVLRLARVVNIAEDGSFGLALVELVAAPFGVIPWLYRRLQAVQAKEPRQAAELDDGQAYLRLAD